MPVAWRKRPTLTCRMGQSLSWQPPVLLKDAKSFQGPSKPVQNSLLCLYTPCDQGMGRCLSDHGDLIMLAHLHLLCEGRTIVAQLPHQEPGRSGLVLHVWIARPHSAARTARSRLAFWFNGLEQVTYLRWLGELEGEDPHSPLELHTVWATAVLSGIHKEISNGVQLLTTLSL